MQNTHPLIRSVATQLAIFVVLTLSITGAWATYTSITAGSIATGQPVNAALMQQIKDNLDDLNARVAKQAISGTVITANLPVPQIRTNTCYGPTANLSITTAGYYSVNINAGGWKYSGNYSYLQVTLADSSNVTILTDSDSFPNGVATSGYLNPNISAVLHLGIGTYTLSVGGSDGNNCAASSINSISAGGATAILMQAD